MAYINYILLDATRMGGKIIEAKEVNPNYRSLLKENLEISQPDVSPYLFSYSPLSEFSQWFMQNGWGKSWGIMIRSHVSPPELLKHCRKFILNVEDAEEIYFRYFDPRVLEIFLPTCTQDQLKEFFGPIDYFMIEGEDANFGELIWLDNYTLQRKRIDITELERRLQAQTSSSSNLDQESPSRKFDSKTELKKPNSNSFAFEIDDNSDEEFFQTLTTVDQVSNKEKWTKFFFEEENNN